MLLIIVATYTIRRRRRNKLHEEAIDFSPFPSSDELIGKHGDIERGGAGGAMGESLTRPSSRGSANDNAFASAAPEMYQTGYAVPTYMPPSGPAAPPKATITSTTNQVAFPSQMYTNTGYNDYGPYPTYAAPINPNPNAYQPQPAANTLAPRPGPSYNTAYGAAITAAGPAPANPPVRKASQRKQVPPLNLSAARPDASPPAYQVTNDTGASPMVNPYGATPNPVDPPLSAVSPVARRASASLLNSPVGLAYSDEGTSAETGASGGSSTRKRTSSHSRMLDPSLPTLPVAAPLPDKFGAQGAAVVVDEKAPIRQLTVSLACLVLDSADAGNAGPERVTFQPGVLAAASIPRPLLYLANTPAYNSRVPAVCSTLLRILHVLSSCMLSSTCIISRPMPAIAAVLCSHSFPSRGGAGYIDRTSSLTLIPCLSAFLSLLLRLRYRLEVQLKLDVS